MHFKGLPCGCCQGSSFHPAHFDELDGGADVEEQEQSQRQKRGEECVEVNEVNLETQPSFFTFKRRHTQTNANNE